MAQNFTKDLTMGQQEEYRAILWLLELNEHQITICNFHDSHEDQKKGDFTFFYENGIKEIIDVKTRRKTSGIDCFKFEVWSNVNRRAGWGITAPYDTVVQVFNFNNYLLKINMHRLKEHFDITPDMPFSDINHLIDNLDVFGNQLSRSRQTNKDKGRIQNIGVTIDIPWSYLHQFVDGYYVHDGQILQQTTYDDFIVNAGI